MTHFQSRTQATMATKQLSANDSRDWHAIEAVIEVSPDVKTVAFLALFTKS